MDEQDLNHLGIYIVLFSTSTSVRDLQEQSLLAQGKPSHRCRGHGRVKSNSPADLRSPPCSAFIRKPLLQSQRFGNCCIAPEQPAARQSQQPVPRAEQLFRAYHSQALSLRHPYTVYTFSPLNTSYILEYIYSVCLFSSKPKSCSSPRTSFGHEESKLGGVSHSTPSGHRERGELRPTAAQAQRR